MTAFDLDQIRVYAEAYALRLRALDSLRTGPLIVTGTNSNPYPAPALRVIDQCERTLDRCLRRLAVSADELNDPGDELAKFLNETD